MKAKLEAIREALAYTLETSPNFHILHKTECAMLKLDELLADLDSQELVEKVAKAIWESDDYNDFPFEQTTEDSKNYNKRSAQAAINVIKG